MKIYSIIPARGGSKGIPRKNLAPLGGKPLIEYSIMHSLSSKLIDKTIVSTDDPEIARVSLELGAEVPFLRPSQLADDHSLDLEVFLHALDFLKNSGDLPDIIVHLRPTCPIRDINETNGAIKQLIENPKLDSVRSIINSPKTPFKMWFNNNGLLTPVIENSHINEPYNVGRQLLPETFLQAANVDVIRTETISNLNSMTGAKIGGYLIDSSKLVDIDLPIDLVTAEKLLDK